MTFFKIIFINIIIIIHRPLYSGAIEIQREKISSQSVKK